MSPGANPSQVTEDMLTAAGFQYTLDWPLDDQPVWISTANGPLLSVPYPHEINDIPITVLHDGSARDFADAVIDNFDEVSRQSREQSLVVGVTIHTFVTGQPFRLKHFRRALEHMTRHRNDVWFTTSGAIARHFAEIFPAPA